MIHEILPDRLMMYVNQAHNICIKTSLNSERGAIYIVTMLLEKVRIQYLGFSG